jgi:hypothetical protein
MASPAFLSFRFSFFEDPDSARNGLDMKSLAALEGEERSRAEDMLLQYLPDTRGVIGLGALRSRRAEPALVQLFEAEQGSGSGARKRCGKSGPIRAGSRPSSRCSPPPRSPCGV